MTSYPLAAIAVGAMGAFGAATLVAVLLARAGFPLPTSAQRIGCVDGLRGYLALSVLVHHFIIWLQVTRLGGDWTAPSINLFNQFGVGAVALFFMTTGLVFYPRVLAGWRACFWPAIYVTRVFRIVPLIAVSVALVTAIIVLRTGRHPDGGFPLAALQWITAWNEPWLLDYPESGRLNAYVLWSLWYEWLFYLLVMPACALAMDATRGYLPSWTVPAALGTLAVLAQSLGSPWPLFQFLPLFAIGMLAHEVQARGSLAGRLRTDAAAILAAGGLVLGVWVAPTPYGAAMPLFALFFTCIACGNGFGGLLRTPAALVLGECSYGIYLLHGLVLSILFVDAKGAINGLTTQVLPLILPLAAGLVSVVTPLTYLAIERPAMRAGRLAGKLLIDRPLRIDSPEVEVAR